MARAVIVAARLTPETAAELRALAAASGKSVSTIMAACIVVGLRAAGSVLTPATPTVRRESAAEVNPVNRTSPPPIVSPSERQARHEAPAPQPVTAPVARVERPHAPLCQQHLEPVRGCEDCWLENQMTGGAW